MRVLANQGWCLQQVEVDGARTTPALRREWRLARDDVAAFRGEVADGRRADQSGRAGDQNSVGQRVPSLSWRLVVGDFCRRVRIVFRT